MTSAFPCLCGLLRDQHDLAGGAVGLSQGVGFVGVENLHEPPTLPELADHARTSLHTFARHFGEDVGTSPGGG